jgi:hypothetical protein
MAFIRQLREGTNPDSVMGTGRQSIDDWRISMRMRRLLALTVTLAALVLTAPVALAAPNPAGHGQPGAECGSPGATSMPAGFGTAGFAHAETVYAGSEGTPSAAHGSSHAVSQYDVACYQVTQAHG